MASEDLIGRVNDSEAMVKLMGLIGTVIPNDGVAITQIASDVLTDKYQYGNNYRFYGWTKKNNVMMEFVTRPTDETEQNIEILMINFGDIV